MIGESLVARFCLRPAPSRAAHVIDDRFAYRLADRAVALAHPEQQPIEIDRARYFGRAGDLFGVKCGLLQESDAVSVYVANESSNDLSVYVINAATGALTSAGNPVAAGMAPRSVTVAGVMQ